MKTGPSAWFIVKFLVPGPVSAIYWKKKKINECINEGMNGLTWLIDSWMSFFTCLIGDLPPDISRILNESLSPSVSLY